MVAINRNKLSDAVIMEIRQMISRGELDEGDKLPNQAEFANQLGVSRTVLREALHTLSDLGVVQQRPKVGTTIISTAPLAYSKLFQSPLQEHPRETINLLEARRYVEAGAAELAAERATPDQIRQLELLVNEMTCLAKAGDYESYARKNAAFHFAISEASQNSFLTLLLSTVRKYMEAWSLVNEVPVLMDQSLISHWKILRAIKNGDPISAKEAMECHMQDFKKRLENYYFRKQDSGKLSGPSSGKIN